MGFLESVNKHTVGNINEPPRDKTNKMSYAPSEDSDQPWHSPSLIRVFAVRMKKLPIERTVKTDQTGRMLRLIRVFARRTCHFVGFVMPLLN